MTSISKDMLGAASTVQPYLGQRRERIASYLRSQLDPAGGFMDRGQGPDLYYSVFGIDALLAIGADLPIEQLLPFLRAHGSGEELDLMHLTCLARCWARLPGSEIPAAIARNVVTRLESYRTPDGGYHTLAQSSAGSVTGTYLACAAYQDIGLEAPDPEITLKSLTALRTADGAYANEQGLDSGSTLSTAGALILQRRLGGEPDRQAADWLWQQTSPTGGFLASPCTPMPDLLSTATAIYAARILHHQVEELIEGCVIFTESLQDDETGGYTGHWLEACPDCEYTFYALLVLGCLMGDSGIDSSEFMD